MPPFDDLASEYGILEPDDLTFLKSIFTEVKGKQKFLEPWQESALAREILYIYGTGVTHRDLLVKEVSSSLVRDRR